MVDNIGNPTGRPAPDRYYMDNLNIAIYVIIIMIVANVMTYSLWSADTELSEVSTHRYRVFSY